MSEAEYNRNNGIQTADTSMRLSSNLESQSVNTVPRPASLSMGKDNEDIMLMTDPNY